MKSILCLLHDSDKLSSLEHITALMMHCANTCVNFFIGNCRAGVLFH